MHFKMVLFFLAHKCKKNDENYHRSSFKTHFMHQFGVSLVIDSGICFVLNFIENYWLLIEPPKQGVAF